MLLERATKLATKFNISMDQIICGINLPSVPPKSSTSLSPRISNQTPRSMSFLPSLVCQDASSLFHIPSTLRWSEVPEIVKSRISSHTSKQESNIQQRWILIMRYFEGQASFMTTDALERDVVSLKSIQTIYSTKQCEVVSLFLSEESCVKFHKLVAKQLSLLYSALSDPPFSTVSSKLLVGTGHNNPYTSGGVVGISHEIVNVKMTVGVHILNVDDGFFSVIFEPDEPCGISPNVSEGNPSKGSSSSLDKDIVDDVHNDITWSASEDETGDTDLFDAEIMDFNITDIWQ